MRLINNVLVTDPSNNIQHVTVEEWKRPNSDTSVWIIQYKGRRITSYEQRLRGWKFGLNALFKLVYEEPMREIIAAHNPFLDFLKKDRSNGSLYHKPVILGIEHGVTFEKK